MVQVPRLVGLCPVPLYIWPYMYKALYMALCVEGALLSIWPYKSLFLVNMSLLVLGPVIWLYFLTCARLCSWWIYPYVYKALLLGEYNHIHQVTLLLGEYDYTCTRACSLVNMILHVQSPFPYCLWPCRWCIWSYVYKALSFIYMTLHLQDPVLWCIWPYMYRPCYLVYMTLHVQGPLLHLYDPTCTRPCSVVYMTRHVQGPLFHLYDPTCTRPYSVVYMTLHV